MNPLSRLSTVATFKASSLGVFAVFRRQGSSPPLKKALIPISCDSHLTWKLGVLDGPLCQTSSVRPKVCRGGGGGGGGGGSRIASPGFGGSEERRSRDVRCSYIPHVIRTVTFESAYDVSFALSHRLCSQEYQLLPRTPGKTGRERAGVQ